MKINYFIAIGLVAIILLAGGAYYYFITKRDVVPITINEKTINEKIRELRRRGDFEKSIQLVERALLSASDKNEKLRFKLILASDYIRTQPKKGIDIFKSVVADTSYSAPYRAVAALLIADAYMNGSRSSSVALDMIFVGEPYESFLKKTSKGNPNIPLAIRKLYEYSTQFYSLPQAEYRIAEWYAKRALAGRLDPNVKFGKSESEYVASIKAHLSKGNAALVKLVAKHDSRKDENSQIGYAYWLKGMLLGNLAELTGNENYLPLAEEAFRRSMELLRNPSAGFNEQAQSLWAAFNYAAFLYRTYGNERADDIKALLAYLSDPRFDDFVFRRYLTRLANSTKEFDTYDRENVRALAKFSTDFQVLLEKLGWVL